jgi:hypothetical protein
MDDGILNSKLRFTGMTMEEQRSFRMAPAPEHVELPKNTRLYKWTSYPLIRWETENNVKRATITQYWSSKDGLTTPTGKVVPTFEEMRKRYRNSNGGVGAPRDWARARSAVTNEWNPMDAILFVQLDQLVWGFVGIAASQNVQGNDGRSSWIGGDWQIVIPGLTERHCHRIG